MSPAMVGRRRKFWFLEAHTHLKIDTIIKISVHDCLNFSKNLQKN